MPTVSTLSDWRQCSELDRDHLSESQLADLGARPSCQGARQADTALPLCQLPQPPLPPAASAAMSSGSPHVLQAAAHSLSCSLVCVSRVGVQPPCLWELDYPSLLPGVQLPAQPLTQPYPQPPPATLRTLNLSCGPSGMAVCWRRGGREPCVFSFGSPWSYVIRGTLDDLRGACVVTSATTSERSWYPAVPPGEGPDQL